MEAVTPKNKVEGCMYGGDFPKYIDLVLKESNLKIPRNEQREQIRRCEPSLMPMNIGFTMEDWAM
jgi:hypothetical protein